MNSSQPSLGPTRLPRREELDDARTGWIKQAAPNKADLSVVDLGQGEMVVKDFGRKAAWVRWIGRIQISRECRAYRWAGEIEGLPKLLGRIDAHALALEKIEGRPLKLTAELAGMGAELHAQLAEIVRRMHRVGLYHLDLRGRDNVMIDREGRLFVLDLGGALGVRPGGWAQALLGRWLEMTDRAALLKWKALLKAGDPSQEEQDFLRRFRFWRSLWIFNRKKRRRRS